MWTHNNNSRLDDQQVGLLALSPMTSHPPSRRRPTTLPPSSSAAPRSAYSAERKILMHGDDRGWPSSILKTQAAGRWRPVEECSKAGEEASESGLRRLQQQWQTRTMPPRLRRQGAKEGRMPPKQRSPQACRRAKP